MRWRARRARLALLGFRRLGRFVGIGPGSATFGAPLQVLRLALLLLAEERQGAAGRLDLVAGGLGGAVHGDLELLRELADAEQLDVLADRPDQALRLEGLGRDGLAGIEAGL